MDWSSSVWPSGSARGTSSVPGLVAPPPLFFPTTRRPGCDASCAATKPAIAPVPPPGGKGTTMRTKRAGQVCASALPRHSTRKKRRTAVRRAMQGLTGRILDRYRGGFSSILDDESSHHAAGGVLEDVAVE